MDIPAASFDADGLRRMICALVRQDGRDLTLCQMGVFLTCYLDDGPQTVRRMAVQLSVPKSAITRALDRLEGVRFARRVKDPRDGRSMLVQRTATGGAFLVNLRKVMAAA